MSTIENARPLHGHNCSCDCCFSRNYPTQIWPAFKDILAAIRQQLPRGYDNTGVWFPLLVNGDEFYIRGQHVVTLAEYERQLTVAING